MKNVKDKKLERKDKKKQKLAALAKVVQLNDVDRQNVKSEERISENEDDDSKIMEETNAAQVADDDGFTKVTYKKRPAQQKYLPDDGDEPDRKRSKVESTAEDEGHGSDASSQQDEEVQRMKLQLTEAEYKDLRRQLRERKRQLENVPSLRLRENGNRASLHVGDEQRTPIFLTDIQHLLMAALIGKKSPCTADRWCLLNKAVRLTHSVVLVLEGLSLYHYLANKSAFVELDKIFDTRLEVILPPHKDSNIVEQLAQVPLTNAQSQQLIEEYGCLESAVEMIKDPTLLVKSIFPIDTQPKDSTSTEDEKRDLPPNDKIPRTKLLLSALQMVDEGYPVPLRGELASRFQNYVFTSDRYEPVTDHSPMFGVDCEMCRTTFGCSELTRISIVNEKYEPVYETLVRPTNKIIDYLTHYSGITAEMMMTATKTLREVQSDVRRLLPPNAILVGQSLNCDLNAMQMMHPYVIDTSVIFNLSGVRRRKSKLQVLAQTFLKETIQKNVDGHDSTEDSLASLKLVHMKLAEGLEFGDEILVQKRRLSEVIRMAREETVKNNLFAHAAQDAKRTAIVTTGQLQSSIKTILEKAEEAAASATATDPSETDTKMKNTLKVMTLHERGSNKETIRCAREIALEHALTIANLIVSEDELQLDEREKTLQKIDKWIAKLWKSVGHNGMFVVLMGGAPDCASGVANIAIKRNNAEATAVVPITI